MTGALRNHIETPNELYEEILKVTTPEQRGNWTADLQCKVTNETETVIDRYKYRHLVTTFLSAIDHTLWFEIPFAFTPWWSDPNKYT